MVEVNGKAQPLVSLIHKSVYQVVLNALLAGRYKVVPVLQAAVAYCTFINQHKQWADQEVASGPILDTQVSSSRQTRLSDGAESAFWDDDQRSIALEQFTNVNTEADLLEVATLLVRKGLHPQIEPGRFCPQK